jgi:leucyl/phenylalanyl-tRNA---protein transferase
MLFYRDQSHLDRRMLSFRHPPRTLRALGSDLRRVALGTAYALRRRRIAVLPQVLAATLGSAVGLERRDACLDEEEPRPRHPLGFVGVCGPLDPDSLMRGFARGLFPFSHVGPKKWWMHRQRMVLPPHEVARDKDVRRLLRNKRFHITFDSAFEQVMRACAEPRPGHVPLTWITEDIIEAYLRLHRRGDAHSFEAWNAEGELVGGGFGIAVGAVFVIESQFTLQRNASKAAMIVLMRHLSAWGFELADGKTHSGYLESMGFRSIPHAQYLAVLRSDLDAPRPGPWTVDAELDAVADWQPEPMRPAMAAAGT